jgi:activating signal cointegrator 1
MKAITLTQPWATLVAIGAKKIETRGWSTTFRGPLAIHAGKGLGPIGGRAGLYDLAFSDPDGYFYPALNQANVFCIDDLPRGAIVATCELVDCVQVLYEWPRNQVVSQRSRHILTDQECAFGDYSPGRYAWLLMDVLPLPEPIIAKGALGLWTWDGALP